MAKNFVRFAVPDGGVSPSDGRSKVGLRVETFDLADPFTNIHTDAGSSCTVVELLGIVEFIYAISGTEDTSPCKESTHIIRYNSLAFQDLLHVTDGNRCKSEIVLPRRLVELYHD